MKRFDINDKIRAECQVTDKTLFGELCYVEHNKHGFGTVLTPIARYFVTKPEFTEGYNDEYWRVDCFFRSKHELCPEHMSTGEDLVAALKRENLCSEPMWLSVHRSEEIEGKPYGDLYED